VAHGAARPAGTGRGGPSPPGQRGKPPGRHKPPPPVKAFFTTALSLNMEEVLPQYRECWAIESEIRDANGFEGLDHEQCRKLPRIVGAHTLRLRLAAARTLWFLEQAGRAHAFNLHRYRP
jgi:hypothetical protein